MRIESKILNILANFTFRRGCGNAAHGARSCAQVLGYGLRVSCAISSRTPHRTIPWKPRAAAPGPSCASGSMSAPDGAATATAYARAARRQAGAHASRPAACRADAGVGGGARRRVGRAARCHRSGQDAADAACQFDHRWRRRSSRLRSPPRWRNISAPILFVTAPVRRAGSSSARRATGIRSWLGRATRSARISCSARASSTSTQPDTALAAARAAIPSDPWRLGARAYGDDADRLGAACARAGAGAAHRRRSLAGRACRRGLEHGAVGPRRARARAPRLRFAELQAAATVLQNM